MSNSEFGENKIIIKENEKEKEKENG